MNKRQLVYFTEVFRCQNIQSASEHLFVSRQGVSKVIRSIEQELGQKLFVRTSEGVFPTDFAVSLYPHAMKLLDEYNYIEGMNTLSTQKKSVLTIYAIDHFAAYLSAEFFEDFGKAYPDITLSIVDTTDDFALDGLMTHKCEVAVVNGPIDFTQYNATELFYTAYCARINKNHPLASKKAISFSDMDGETIAGKGRSYSCFRRNIDKFLLEPGLNVNILVETSDESVLTSLVSKNQAIVLGYDYSALLYPHKDVAVLPLDLPESGQYMYLVERKDMPVTKTCRIFKEFVTKWIKDHNKQYSMFEK